jgi:hypothetical protein
MKQDLFSSSLERIETVIMRCHTLTPLLIALLFIIPGQASAAELKIAELKAVSGQVWLIVPPLKEEIPAKAPRALPAGARIRTGAESSAELVFPDGSILKIRSNSAMQLSPHKRRAQGKSSVLLFFGRLWNKVVKKVGAQSSYEITTANAVCGVRGTEFETAVGEDGTLRVRVLEGAVSVAGDTNENLLKAGTEAQANEDGVGESRKVSTKPGWRAWDHSKLRRLGQKAKPIIDSLKRSALYRKEQIEKLRKEQRKLINDHKHAKERLEMGDPRAADTMRNIKRRLNTIADKLADAGDRIGAQAGLVDRFADIASDPRFKMIDRKYLEIEAQSLRKVQSDLDAMVKEGIDISAAAMDDLMKQMRNHNGGLKDKKGSTVDDLFGPGANDLDFR